MRTIDVNPKDRPASIDPGPAPMMQWLRIENLVVDESYQRDLKRENWTAIRRIAGQFKWSRFSPVFVAPIEGGRYAIIDGQHRTHAAAICGFAEVPCQIVQMTREEQAASFAAVNGLVTKVRAGQIYKAALAAGQENAVACRDAVEAAGCRLMANNATTQDKKPGEIFALALVQRQVKAGRSKLLTTALRSLRDAECGRIADYWNGFVLKSWVEAVACRPHLEAVDLSGFLDDFDIWDAVERAEEAAKKKRRLGFSAVSRYELAEAEIGEQLDLRFANKVAA